MATTAISCGNVKIKDQEWCGDLGPRGGTCFHTLAVGADGKQVHRRIPKEQWDSARRKMVCTETGNYADMKGVVEKLCHQTGACSYDQKQQLDALFGNLGAVEKEQNESGDSK